MILSLFLHSEPLDLESWAEFAASNWELSWEQHKLPHLRRIIAQAEVDSWIMTVSFCVTRLVTRGFGNIEFSHSVISTQPSDRQCMHLVVQAVDELVSRFQGNASVASIDADAGFLWCPAKKLIVGRVWGTNIVISKLQQSPFLSDPGKPGVRSMGPDVRQWATLLRPNWCDPADEDTNSILTDNANRAIQGNAMQQCKWCV